MLEVSTIRQSVLNLVVAVTAIVLSAPTCQAETSGTSPSAAARRYHYTNEFARDAYEADRRSLRPIATKDDPLLPGGTGGGDTPPAAPDPNAPPEAPFPGQAPKSQAQQAGPATSTPGNGEEFKLPFWTEHANQKDDHVGPCRGCASPVFRVVKGEDAVQTPSFRSAYMAAAFHGTEAGRKPFEGYGIPLTDTSFYAMAKQVSERKLAILNDPMNLLITARGRNQTQVQLASSATADAAESCFDTNLDYLRTPLINVANEQAGVPTTGSEAQKRLENVIWMVQRMYKSLYMPMALLLLLPGAILTQFRGMVSFGILGQTDDAPNPFSGILRALIAIFLIPCTQLIVSYSIDVGNSLTYEIQSRVDPTELTRWAHQQTFNAPMANTRNIYMEPKTFSYTPFSFLSLSIQIPGIPNPMVAGLSTNGPEQASEVEQQSFTTQTMQMILNLINMGFSIGLSMLLGFQTVMMCYLFLLGPIAAALYAWPSGIGVNVNNAGSLFQRVFSNWVDAVMTLALWRFWWCVVILVMVTRIAYLQDIGGYQPNSQWEVLMYTAFMVILTTVPFLPFDFRPGDMASKALDKASQASNDGGAPDSGGGGGNPQDDGDRGSAKRKNK